VGGVYRGVANFNDRSFGCLFPVLVIQILFVKLILGTQIDTN